MISLLTLAAASCAIGCSAGFALVKRGAPITNYDARVIWAMHKRDSGCQHGKLRLMRRRKDKIVGFECGCGYKFQQKRPLLSRMPKA